MVMPDRGSVACAVASILPSVADSCFSAARNTEAWIAPKFGKTRTEYYYLVMAGMNATRTIHVVDDDPAMRDSLRMLLEASGFVVRVFDSASALLTVSPGGIGCVLTDVRMPDIDGIALLRRLRDLGCRLPVIVMTGQGDIAIAVQAMKAGAVDFLEKPFGDDALFEAIGRALEQSERLREIAALSESAASRLAMLTPREREVFDLLVSGLPNKAIANSLGASPRTIEVHRARVFEKLKANNLPDLVRLVLAAEGGG
jgi:two-component system, LuxR family, response regulator FixJ